MSIYLRNRGELVTIWMRRLSKGKDDNQASILSDSAEVDVET